MNTDLENKKVPWQIRTSKRIKKTIEDYAVREGRTTNNMVEIIFCKALGLNVDREV